MWLDIGGWLAQPLSENYGDRDITIFLPGHIGNWI